MMTRLLITCLLALVFALLGRSVALRKNRRVFEWSPASAVFPPALLVLLLIPKRRADEQPA